MNYPRRVATTLPPTFLVNHKSLAQALKPIFNFHLGFPVSISYVNGTLFLADYDCLLEFVHASSADTEKHQTAQIRALAVSLHRGPTHARQPAWDINLENIVETGSRVTLLPWAVKDFVKFEKLFVIVPGLVEADENLTAVLVDIVDLSSTRTKRKVFA